MEYGEEIEAPDVPVERRSNFDLSKKQARALQIGDRVTVVVKGEVCGISRGYGGPKGSEPYTIEVKFKGLPEIKSNSADASVRSLMGEKTGTGPRHKNEADKSLDDIHSGKTRAY